MDWTFAGCNFLRRVAAVFLFVGAGDLWRRSGHLGNVLLWLYPAQCFRRTLVHAGCSFAESGPDRSLFFSPLDRRRKIDIAVCSRNDDLAGAADQTSERHYWRAASVPRLAKMALEFCQATVALAFRHDYNFAFNCVVLARPPNFREILSASFLRRGWNSDRKVFMVLEDRTVDRNFESHADPLGPGACRSVRVTAREICACLSLVARCDNSLHHCRGLRESSSVVSTSARADRCCVCRRSLPIYQVEDF